MRVPIPARRPQDSRLSAPQVQPFLATRKYCMFLQKLPPELRNMVYALVLAVRPNESGTVLLTTSPRCRKKPSVLSLLQTCRAMHNEARSMFYFLNSIGLRTQLKGKHSSKSLGGCLRTFLRSLKLARKYAIHELTLTAASWEAMTSALRQLPPLMNLGTLILVLDGSLEGAGDCAVVEEYNTEIKFWRKLVYCLPPMVKEVRVRAVRDSRGKAHAMEAQGLEKWLNDALRLMTRRRRRVMN